MDTLLHFARRVANDKDFGPQYLNQFDFTLTFEASIFNILPASIIIFVCPLFIFHYNAKPVVAPQSAMLWSKIVCFTGHMLNPTEYNFLIKSFRLRLLLYWQPRSCGLCCGIRCQSIPPMSLSLVHQCHVLLHSASS